MILFVNQVGKRWFLVTGKGVDVEASFAVGINHVENPEQSRVAGYKVYDWVPKKRWTLTGKGARKHRDFVIEAISSMLGGESE